MNGTKKNPAAWRDRRWHVGSLTYTTGGLALLFLWLLGGDFGFWFKERAVPPTVQLLLRQYHASDLLVGLLLTTLPQALALVTNPVVAHLSDRHRGRWGRRIPFLLATTPVAVVAMCGLAFGPPLGRWLHQVLGAFSPGETVSVLTVLGLFWTVFEFCTVVCNALLIALITDVVPKEVIGRFFALFRVASLGAGMVWSYFLLGKAEEHYSAIFLLLAAVYGASFGLMCLKVKEGELPPPPPAAPRGLARGFVNGAGVYLKDCLANPYYRWIYLASALSVMAFIPVNTYALYFAQSLEMSMDAFGKYGTVMLAISLVQAYPIGWLVDRYHPLRLTLIALACFSACALTAFFCIRTTGEFGFMYVLCGVMGGFWATAWAPLATMLFPRDKFGAFYAVLLVANALGQMLIALLCGWMLDRLDHDYRFIYLWASGLALLGLLAYAIVYRRFLKLGGVRNYVAP